MSQLIANKTQIQLQNFINNPSHSLLLNGEKGVGKLTLGRYLVSSVLEVPLDKLDNYPYFKVITPDDGKNIGIDVVRELDHFLSLKTVSSNSISRVILIDNSQFLSLEAQNALLKMLEEPPEDTLFILSVSNPNSLLTTIKSRMQLINVMKPEIIEVKAFFKKEGFNEIEINKAASMTGGLPGLMYAILNDEEHPLKKATKLAREILSKSTYDRLVMVDDLSKDRELLKDTLYILKQMAHISLLNDVDPIKWKTILKSSYEANELIELNSQPKLCLDKLMLSL